MTAHPEAAPAWTPEEEARAVRVLAEFMGWREAEPSERAEGTYSVNGRGEFFVCREVIRSTVGDTSVTEEWNPFRDANAEQQVTERALEAWGAVSAEAVHFASTLARAIGCRLDYGVTAWDFPLHLRTGDRARAIYRTITNEAR